MLSRRNVWMKGWIQKLFKMLEYIINFEIKNKISEVRSD